MPRRMLLEGLDVGVACPECGGDMLVRTVHSNSHQFLGCSNYPACEHTEPIPTTLLIADELELDRWEEVEGEISLILADVDRTKYHIRLSAKQLVKFLAEVVR